LLCCVGGAGRLWPHDCMPTWASECRDSFSV